MQPEMIERLDDRLEATNQEIYFVYEALFDGLQKLNDTLSVIALQLTERREEGERENPPHTPYKEKEAHTPYKEKEGGEEKKAALYARACEDNSTKSKKHTAKKRKPQPRFAKPTIEEVAAYCKERGNGIDPVQFWNFYNSKGWCVGKNKMKDWQSSVRTWEKRDEEDAANQPSHFGKGQVAYLKPTQEDINKSEGVL